MAQEPVLVCVPVCRKKPPEQRFFILNSIFICCQTYRVIDRGAIFKIGKPFGLRHGIMRKGSVICDRGYQYCRSKFSSRKEYWNNLRIVIRVMLFTDFDHLLHNVADPPEVRAPG